ncbi:MAG: peptide MFS transporter, partial [Chloroflexia bacterium]
MATPNTDTAFFGHPRGLSTLFFTEMWERFSYYGLRAILVLYMVADPSTGGLGFSIAKASAIYSLYASMNYLLALPGGWLADKFLGLRNAVLIGGVLIATGNALMYFPGLTTFYCGLAFIICGTGLLKTNASTMVGTLYGEKDTRRDSGFSIYYMGINIGALVSPLIVGYLAQRVNWRYGFPVASIFMLIGLVQFYFGAKYFPERVFKPVAPANIIDQQERVKYLKIGTAGIIALIAAAFLFAPSVEGLADSFGAILVTIVAVVLGGLLFKGSPNAYERRRLAVVCILFFIAT